MNKKWNGYLTVEASFLMPMVLFLYMLVILCGFYLYNRCVISQDNYLLAFRGSRFTDAAENYGEVIYGETEETDPDESYLKSRMAKKASLYPFCRIQEQRVAYDKGIGIDDGISGDACCDKTGREAGFAGNRCNDKKTGRNG